MAATLTSGGKWPGIEQQTEPGAALIWSGEDHFETSILPRFIAAGGERALLEHINGVEATTLRAFNPAHDLPLIAARLRRPPKVRLIIIDPIRMAASGVGEALRASLQGIATMAMQHRVGVIGITHLRKQQARSSPQSHRVLGAVDYVGVARIVLLADHIIHPALDEEVRSLLCVKMNNGPTDHHLIYAIAPCTIEGGIKTSKANLEEFLLAPLDTLIQDTDPLPSENVKQCAAVMFELLKDGPRHCEEVRAACEEADFTPKIIRKAREFLGLTTIRLSVGAPAMWVLSPAARARYARGARGAQKLLMVGAPNMGMTGMTGRN